MLGILSRISVTCTSTTVFYKVLTDSIGQCQWSVITR